MFCCFHLTFGFSLFPSIFPCLSLSLCLPLFLSVRWFMALFKRRPRVSPDAAICFNPTSFFHSSPSEGNQEPTKINPWLLCMQQSVCVFGSSPVVPASEELDRASWWLHCCSDKVPSRLSPLLLLLGVCWRCRKMTCHKDAINNAHRQGWKNGRRHKALLSV